VVLCRPEHRLLSTVGKRKASDKPYIGDRILAAYQLLGSCCCLGTSSVLIAAGAALVAKPPFVKDIQKQYPGEAWKYLNDAKYTLAVALLLLLATIFVLCWVVGTWRSRRWALWLHLIFHGSGGILGLFLETRAVGEIVSLGIALYCALRLSGSLGEKTKPPVRRPRRGNGRRRRKA